MAAADLIAFARAHLDGGESQYGERLPSPASAEAMQTSHWEYTGISQFCRKYQGLGWMISEYPDGSHSVGHNGATNGFLSGLMLLPEKNAAFAILLNSFDNETQAIIIKDLMQALVGISLEEPEPAGNTEPAFLHQFVGHYESFDTAIDVFMKYDKLFTTITYKVDPLPPLILAPCHVQAGCFATYTDSNERKPNILFQQSDEQGVPRYLFNGLRLNTKI